METTELRLCDITRYEDVEVGRLRLTVEEHQKTWIAIWQTNMHIYRKMVMPLPRGPMPLKLMAWREWVECVRIKAAGKTFRRLLPLETTRWIDFGVNIYVCQPELPLTPITKAEYDMLCNALRGAGVKQLVVDEPSEIINKHYLKHQDEIINSNFWDK